MATSIVIWDAATNPEKTKNLVLFWRGCAIEESGISIPSYLVKHDERLRAKYLTFIYELGEKKFGDKSLVEYLCNDDGLSYWWLTHLAEKNPLQSQSVYQCLKLLALEEILTKNKGSKVVLHSADSALAESLRVTCLNVNTTFSWINIKQVKKISTLRYCYKKIPYFIQALVSFTRYINVRWSLRRLNKPKWSSGNKSVFIFSHFIHFIPEACEKGNFKSGFWGELPKLLNNDGYSINWLQHFLFSSSIPNTETGIRWLENFNSSPTNQECHAFLDSYLTWGVLLRALKNWSRLYLSIFTLRYVKQAFISDETKVDFWPILKDDWFNSVCGAVALRNCLIIELLELLLRDVHKQSKCFYLCENQGWERALIFMWKKHGLGDIIGFQHATAPFWHLYYFDDPRSFLSKQKCFMPLPDRLAINGDHARKAFVKSGFPINKLIKVEALRYLNIQKKQSSSSLNSAYDALEVIHTGKNILILGDMFPLAMQHLSSILKKAIKLTPSNYKLSYKPHPGYVANVEVFSDLKIKIIHNDLAKVMTEFDIAISANSTSASVDAYQSGLPVIIVYDESELNLSPLYSHQGVRFVKNENELSNALLSLNESSSLNTTEDEFFYIDKELTYWKKLLATNFNN
jgi:surface carbohydrate biosynthesis protein (TIGR04326 family)